MKGDTDTQIKSKQMMGKANEKDRCDGQEWVVRKDHVDIGAGPGHFIGGSPGYMEGRTLGVRHQV